MISEFINFSIRQKTGIIKLNRPEALNALNYDMASNIPRREKITKSNPQK